MHTNTCDPRTLANAFRGGRASAEGPPGMSPSLLVVILVQVLRVLIIRILALRANESSGTALPVILNSQVLPCYSQIRCFSAIGYLTC